MIVTSYLFPDATFALDRLRSLAALVGPDRLVVDLRSDTRCRSISRRTSLTTAQPGIGPCSCRRVPGGWCVAMNKWQTLTDTFLSRGAFPKRGRELTDSGLKRTVRVRRGRRAETLATMAPFCSEFLIHAADVEGLCRGIDEELVVGALHARAVESVLGWHSTTFSPMPHSELGRWTTLPCTYAGGAACTSGWTPDCVRRCAKLTPTWFLHRLRPDAVQRSMTSPTWTV